MARLREIPSGVAQQSLSNKVLNEEAVREAFEGEATEVDMDDLELVATDVGVPELLPYEYVYVDVYTDRERFFIDVNENKYRRSSTKSLQTPS